MMAWASLASFNGGAGAVGVDVVDALRSRASAGEARCMVVRGPDAGWVRLGEMMRIGRAAVAGDADAIVAAFRGKDGGAFAEGEAGAGGVERAALLLGRGLEAIEAGKDQLRQRVDSRRPARAGRCRRGASGRPRPSALVPEAQALETMRTGDVEPEGRHGLQDRIVGDVVTDLAGWCG